MHLHFYVNGSITFYLCKISNSPCGIRNTWCPLLLHHISAAASYEIGILSIEATLYYCCQQFCGVILQREVPNAMHVAVET
jgi:hypothetical protein